MKRVEEMKIEDRCELAMMGKVVPVKNEEVQKATEYLVKTLRNGKPILPDYLNDMIRKYTKKIDVAYIVVNTIAGMECITYLLKSNAKPLEYPCTDETSEYFSAPFEEDYGSGYPSAFCYVFNLVESDFSEFGDCFFQKKDDNFYHRVS